MRRLPLTALATELTSHRRIADMMVQDAKERQKQWGQTGYTAYLEEEERCVDLFAI